MSSLLSAGATGLPLLAQDDQRVGDEAYFDNEDLVPQAVLLSTDWRALLEHCGFMSPWWPFRGYLIGDGAAGLMPLLELSARHGDIWRAFGANGRLGFVGFTRNQYGSPLGGCTVRCFLASTSELVSQVVSDDAGFYIATTPYVGAHFLTVHKAGSPDVAGASIDTLIAS